MRRMVLLTELEYSPKPCERVGLHSLQNIIHLWNTWRRCENSPSIRCVCYHSMFQPAVLFVNSTIDVICDAVPSCCGKNTMSFCTSSSEAVLFHFLMSCSVDPVGECNSAYVLEEDTPISNGRPTTKTTRGPTGKINEASVVYDATFRWCNLPQTTYCHRSDSEVKKTSQAFLLLALVAPLECAVDVLSKFKLGGGA